MPFISENELERALVKAVKNPAVAADFYRQLLEADLLVMGTAEGQEGATEKFTLAPGGRVNLVTGARDGRRHLPAGVLVAAAHAGICEKGMQIPAGQWPRPVRFDPRRAGDPQSGVRNMARN